MKQTVCLLSHVAQKYNWMSQIYVYNTIINIMCMWACICLRGHLMIHKSNAIFVTILFCPALSHNFLRHENEFSTFFVM